MIDFKSVNIDAFIVSGTENKRYFSGFTGSTSEVILSANKNFFITDGRYKTQSKQEVKGFDIELAETQIDYFTKVIDILKREKFTRVGLESDKVSIEVYNKLQSALPEVKFVFLPKFVENLRMIKSPEEIAKIKKAVAITDETFSNVIKKIKEGMTEKEVQMLVDSEHYKAGADKLSFDTIVAFGENTAKPHAEAGNRILKKGDNITIDFGCFKDGYCSDMTRTFFYGKENLNEKLVEIHNIVLEAHEMQIAAIKPGKTTKEIDSVGRDYITSKGYGEFFMHGTGHGIGLEIHEAPRIIQSYDIEIKEGMVFTIEPGIYVEGIGGVRIENDIVVTKDGCESLNKAVKGYDIIK